MLSGLKWRMSPVTPISFLDHIIRRLGLKSYAHWEFLRSCENLLLSVVSGERERESHFDSKIGFLFLQASKIKFLSLQIQDSHCICRLYWPLQQCSTLFIDLSRATPLNTRASSLVCSKSTRYCNLIILNGNENEASL